MFVEALALVAGLLAVIYFYLQYKWTYWTGLGVKCPPNVFPMGNNPIFHQDVFLARKNFNDVAREQYELLKGEKFYGTYTLTRPVLVLMDPEIMKQVMVKDFNNFVDRNSPEFLAQIFSSGSLTDELWKKQLTSVGGEEWKDMRSMFSPIFTSGKMKSMMTFIHDVSDQLIKAIGDEVDAGNEFELKKLFGKFSMDSIASCAFGVNASSFNDDKTVFVKNAKEIFRQHVHEGILFMLSMIPGVNKLIPLFGISIFKPKETKFFYDIIKGTIEHRIKTKSRRNDLIDMMIDAMKNENVAIVKKEEESEDQFDIDSKLAYTRKTSNLSGEKEFDEISIIATALVILVAGYDTTAQTMSYMAYELVKNPDIQRRLQEEIDAAFEDAGGHTPDYGVIQSLPYLDQVIHETLRLHPAVGIITRACTEEYTLQTPGFGSGTIKIPQNMEVHMNVSGMHKDPKHYPNPDTFNPDNFSKESKATRHPYSFLGFGTGPRSCIGMRFALLEAKVAMVDMMSKFTFLRSERTPDVIEIDPRSQLGAPKQMIYIRAERR